MLCTEVVEHIAKPREFMRKLLAIGHTVVLSVPYRWASCETEARTVDAFFMIPIGMHSVTYFFMH